MDIKNNSDKIIETLLFEAFENFIILIIEIIYFPEKM